LLLQLLLLLALGLEFVVVLDALLVLVAIQPLHL
jgi:hypothetical protein